MEQPLPMSLPPLLPPTSGFGSSMRPGDGEGYPPGGPPGPPFPGDGPLPPNRAPTPENMSPNPNSNPGKYKEKKILQFFLLIFHTNHFKQPLFLGGFNQSSDEGIGVW